MKFLDTERSEVIDAKSVKHAMTLLPIVIQAARGIEINDIEAEQECLSKLFNRKVIIMRYGYEVVRGI
ncbi:hypothetical protein BM530_04490 [Clostridioides difficile]|nr:hypothetical protein BM530_04490 [Clostridioides difficile]